MEISKMANLFAKLNLFIVISALSSVYSGCDQEQETKDERSLKSADAIPASLEAPSLRITLQQDRNILEWDEVPEAVSYDLLVASPDSLNLDVAERIENVLSPYTHAKDGESNFLYAVIAKGATTSIFSEPSASVSDVPSGYLATCLSYVGEAQATRDALLAASGIASCYDLLPQIPEITTLDLSGQELSDLTPLAELTNLSSLNLSNNFIADIGSLIGLENLKTLNLSNNTSLANIDALNTKVQLEELAFSSTAVTDLEFLRELVELKSLTMESTSVSSLAAIAALPNLETAALTGNIIERQEATCPTVSVMGDLARFCLDGATISYAAQIIQLMTNHCTSCHNINNAARVNLDNETDVVNAAAQVNARISDGTMPPNGPLSDTDKAIIASWYANTVLAAE